MSDSSNSDQSAHSAGPQGAGGDPDNNVLSHVEAPGITPGSPDAIKTDAAKTEAAAPAPATSRDGTDRPPNPVGATPARPYGTALILPPQRAKAEAPQPEPPPAKSAPRSSFGARAAVIVAAAAVGGLAGSLASAGVSYLTAPQQAAPSQYTTLAETLGRVDHELKALKSTAESSTKATGQQVAKIAERLDRAEKAQADAGAKTAKAADSIDRIEHRLAAAAGDVTGAIGEPHVAVAAAPPTAPDVKRPSPALIVDGWVVRDVYNGSAMIQGRAGMIEVVPGDILPGLGRIEQVKRQDGRWVVVTSRGLIVSR
jgi:hypothetical protein